MNARRLLLALALVAAPLAPAAAQDVVRVAVGGELGGRNGEQIYVPVTVDMTGAPGRLLGGYRLRLSWDPSALSWNGLEDGNFAPVDGSGNYNSDSVSQGILRVAALQPGGSSGVLTLFASRFYVLDETVTSNVTLQVDDLTQALTFEDLMPFAQVSSGVFCRSLGRWGDTNNDTRSDSRDALIALSRVVGLIDTLRLDTISIVPLVVDTIRPALADVDSDDAVTSRDALIILSHAVGLPVDGFRIGLTAAGACATGSAIALEILPGVLDLESNQSANVIVQARDASGRVVPTTPLIWRSSDATIASVGGPDFEDLRASGSIDLPRSAITAPIGIEGRSPGTATLTAEMGPGIRATMTVNVVARRRVWHADVRYLGAATQTGTLTHPFGRIAGALDAAHDDDTVLVAAGTYPETLNEYKSVAILGDPANRPIIDGLAVPYYNPGQNLVYLGNPMGKATLAHLVLRGGGAYLEGHDNEVRRVRIEMGDVSPDIGLEIYAYERAEGSGPPGSYGNVLIDSVEIVNMPSSRDGIVIDQADTITVRHSSVAGTGLPNDCFEHALEIFEAGQTLIHDNTFSNFCAGIYVDQDQGRVVLSRNRITNMRRTGLDLRVPVIRLDHNVVRDLIAPYAYHNGAYGLYVPYFAEVDSLSSVGDSIVNTGYYGAHIDGAGMADIDSLTVSGTGQDSGFGGDGLFFQRGFIRLRHSRIHNVLNASGVRICDLSSAELRGNRVRDVTDYGIRVASCSEGQGVDSVSMAHDTVINTGYGIDTQGQLWARIDSAIVDSIGFGGALSMNSFNRGIVNAVRLSRAGGDGVYISGVDTVALTNSRVELMGGVGVVLNSFSPDSMLITGNTIDAAVIGLRAFYANVRLDSNRITNHLNEGLLIDFDAGVRATRTRLSGNGLGVRMTGSARSSYINRSTIGGNLNRQGARNDGFVELNADTVFWGDPTGPACAPAVGSCAVETGDSVLTTGITFANHLFSPDPATPAPPAGLVARLSVTTSGVVRPSRDVVRPAAAVIAPQPPEGNVRRRVPKSRSDSPPQR